MSNKLDSGKETHSVEGREKSLLQFHIVVCFRRNAIEELGEPQDASNRQEEDGKL